jgi:ABC-type transport system involved in cytochrome bd biosynthesis fused ATPase/permease subunit
MRLLVIATIACIAGAVVLLAVKGSEIVTAAGIVLGGTAFVLVLSTIFYAIGRSEDRERAARQGRPDK